MPTIELTIHQTTFDRANTIAKMGRCSTNKAISQAIAITEYLVKQCQAGDVILRRSKECCGYEYYHIDHELFDLAKVKVQ